MKTVLAERYVQVAEGGESASSAYRRQIKCNRAKPCSSCVAAKVQCLEVQKRPRKRQRILPSGRYEENLTTINRQLEVLSSTLQTLKGEDAVSSRRESSDGCVGSPPSNEPAAATLFHDEECETPTDQQIYEGQSSFNTQSKEMTEALGIALSSASAKATDLQTVGRYMTQTTGDDFVQKLVKDARAPDPPTFEQGPSRSTSCAFSDYPELSGLSLPPKNLVLRLLAFTKASPQWYFVIFVHKDEEEFTELCQKLYFPTQPFTIFAWISVNCGLYYLFRDLDKSHYDKLQMTKGQVSDAVAICSKNIDKAVKSLKLCVGSSFQAVDALACATAVNTEGARGSLGWQLISAAARMSIDLGYHRLPPGYGDRQRSQKRKLFWFIYSMDKSLAFSFGRSPTIQDYDVTTERPTYPEDFRFEWGLSFLGHIDFVETQYDIYKQLFSAKAQQEPTTIRVRRAHECAAKLLLMKDKFIAAPTQDNVLFPAIAREVTSAMDIGFSSILTLIYRVLPTEDSVNANGTMTGESHPLQFHPLCVEAGRAALRGLLYRWKAVSSDDEEDAAKLFTKWTLFLIPFMPYLAVFGNQIATGSQEDLTLLRDVARIVEIAEETSSAVNTISKAFSRLLRIAEVWTSTINNRERKQHQAMQPLTTTTHEQGAYSEDSGKQPLSSGYTADLDPVFPDATDFSMVDWQDMELLPQDWDTMFNEFDLGLGAESARDMMPWFEQHMAGSNTFN